MPQISPLAPLRYNSSAIADLGAVIAPPYDVITPERRAQLLAASPHNVIQLILPEGEGDDRYAHAGDLFRSWIASGILVRDGAPALYPYVQVFTHPATGESVRRMGVIAAMQLSPFGDGQVLPHERTLSGPKADRLKLMQATSANLEAIFGVYPDPSGASGARLADACAADPLIDVVDADGVRHCVWRITDHAAIGALQADLAAGSVFIVDGHHRYETALNYQKAKHEAHGVTSDAPYDSILIFLTPSSDPGLVILPTHRVLHSLPTFSFAELRARLHEHFVLEDLDNRADALARLAASGRMPAFLLLNGEAMTLATVRDHQALAAIADTTLAPALRELDVVILHNHMFEHLLGISQQAQAEQRYLHYVKNDADAFAAASQAETQMVAMMNPTRLEQVEAVAASGEVMPQKSTYFYPKLASGLLFNYFEPGPPTP